MPAPIVIALAKKAGVSPAKAEKIWKTVKSAVIGAKLKDGSVIPEDFDKWTADMWAYCMGAMKKALGTKESATLFYHNYAQNLIDKVIEGSDLDTVLADKKLWSSRVKGVLNND